MVQTVDFVGALGPLDSDSARKITPEDGIPRAVGGSVELLGPWDP